MRSWKTQSGRALIVHYFHHRYGIKPEGLNHWECEKLVIQSGWSLGECGWHRIGDLHNVKMGWDYIELLRDASGQVVTRPGKHGDLREALLGDRVVAAVPGVNHDASDLQAQSARQGGLSVARGLRDACGADQIRFCVAT